MDAPAPAALHEAKQALRARVLAARDAIAPGVRQAASEAIAARLAALPAFASAHTVLLTLPFGSEWDTLPLARDVAASHRRLVVPRVERATRMLALHHVEDPEGDIAPGYRGIPEPREACPVVAPTAIDFVLVPGVAFDVHGHRLGYGGGFYDRLLPLLRADAVLVAGAFEEQIVAAVPTASHDQRLPCIVTPARVIVVARP